MWEIIHLKSNIKKKYAVYKKWFLKNHKNLDWFWFETIFKKLTKK